MKRSRKSREINRLKEQNSQKTHMLMSKKEKDCKNISIYYYRIKRKNGHE